VRDARRGDEHAAGDPFLTAGRKNRSLDSRLRQLEEKVGLPTSDEESE
jgi:hypothetical protein